MHHLPMVRIPIADLLRDRLTNQSSDLKILDIGWTWHLHRRVAQFDHNRVRQHFSGFYRCLLGITPSASFSVNL